MERKNEGGRDGEKERGIDGYERSGRDAMKERVRDG
jgi:hypothetical protein